MLAARTAVSLLAALVFCGAAHAAGGNYVFDGGTAGQQAQVRAALAASAFDWSIVPVRITIHIARGVRSEATPGDIWIDSDLVNAKRFAWGTIQHEYAHQVDFFAIDPLDRALLERALGGQDWCYDVLGLAHGDYGCERFASTLAWSYWPSAQNALRPASPGDESAAMAPGRFRALLKDLIGAPDLLTGPRY
jgi:hypothetical protein